MPRTEPSGGFSKEEFDILIEACWEQIALFAFEHRFSRRV